MARCVCSQPGVIGCSCTLVDSTSIDVSAGASPGSVANPYTLTPIIDPAASNRASCGASGLTATFSDVMPQVSVLSSAGNSINNNAETPFIFDTERYDTDTMWTAGGNADRITINTAGLYVISVAVSFLAGSGSTGKRQVALITSVGQRFIEHGCTEATNTATFTTALRFTAAQYFKVWLYQNSGGALVLYADVTACKLPEA